MRICMFTNTYLPHVGGVANSVAAFTEDVRERGHRVLVVAPTYAGLDSTYKDNGDVLRVPAIQKFSGGDFSVRIPVPFIIADTINDFRPDLIHSHHPYVMGDAAMRTAFRLKQPLVFTHHTRYEEYTHYVPTDSEAMRRFVIHLSTEYANMCSHVIAPSESLAKLIRKRGVVSPVSVIPTGIDIRLLQSGNGERFRKRSGIGENAQVIGHVGRLAPEKNLEYLAMAAADALKKLPSASFLVVGSGSCQTEIEGIFKERSLADRLIMAGKLTGQDLYDAYAAMDLFVFSSKSETQGLVLAEAMAAGKPVIALDASGVREVVVEGENGRLLPQDAGIDMFSDAVIDGFRNEDARRKWRTRIVETAESFSRRRCSDKLVALYQSVLEKECMAENRCSIRAEEEDMWEKLLRRLRIEWEMLSQKAAAVAHIVSENKDANQDAEKNG